MKFIQPLRVARAEKHLTQAQLAHVAGINQSTLSFIENGVHRPNRSTREKIEKVIGKVDWARTFDEGTTKRQILTN